DESEDNNSTEQIQIQFHDNNIICTVILLQAS
ncbi:MAG: hypothetical protein ACI8RD_006471, partial [Bacillariaceae sp.]